MRRVWLITALLLASGWVTARAEAPRHAGWQLVAGGGATLFTTSQSKVVDHLLKPDVRFGARWQGHGPALGFEVQATASGEAGYRAVGALATVAAPLWDGEVFALELTFATGVGTGPRIFHWDLLTEEAATLWVRGGVGCHWWLPGDRVALGVLIDALQLSAINLDVAVTVRL